MIQEGGVEAQKGSDNIPSDDRLLVKWLENQADHEQVSFAQTKFKELLFNATQPRDVSVNACIKLCYFIEQCLRSKSGSIRRVSFSSENCVDLFKFYIDWSETNHTRSMRQVLDLISTLIAKNPDAAVASAIKSSVLDRILSILAYQGSQAFIKPAFKSLEYLLSKGTISTGTFIEAFGSRKSLASENPSALWDTFFLELFEWVALQDVAPAAGKLLVTLFIQIGKDGTKRTVDTISWQIWIRAGLDKNPSAIENVKNYIFLPLFKLDRQNSVVFLGQLNNHRPVTDSKVMAFDCHALLQLAAIEVGKKAGLIEEPCQFKQATKKAPVVVDLKEDTISVLLSNSSDTVRSLAFSVMVSSSSTIRPFSIFALETLRANLSNLCADTDAKLRNEVLSNLKHMIDRLRGAIGFLVREIDTMKSKLLPDTAPSSEETLQISDAEKLLLAHKQFVEWYFDFLLEELVPTTSYQRHYTALKVIELLLRSGILDRKNLSPVVQKSDNDTVWPYHFNFFTTRSLRLLLDLLMDPFEDVRSGATAILKLASPKDFNHGSSSNDLLRSFSSRAEHCSKMTGRADYADGVARSYDILYSFQDCAKGRLEVLKMLVDEIESKIVIAESNLGQAVLEAPVHGQFAGLSLVWSSIDHKRDFVSENSEEEFECAAQLQSLQQRATDQCCRIWLAVKDILCNDSPEGHLPRDLDETDSIDTKDVLSYSFRAIHESSNLMRTIINKLTSASKEKPLVTSKVFAQIGDLTYEQLSSLRHRGAFATVTLTFFRCCVLTQTQEISSNDLLKRWYQGALNCIYDQVSTTRRSAGIPALITGIMVANAKAPAFGEIVNRLKSIATEPAYQSPTDGTSLPQVHAMNSLKDMFKSSALGRKAESHIGGCLQIAVDSLRSEIWAIRNCGLLLLRSLIDCLFGTSDSKTAIEAGWDGKSIKISYDKYPTLPSLLVKLLSAQSEPGTQFKPEISAVESVFPALDIIRRSGPPSASRNEIYQLVMIHLGSRVWNVREMAAHAMSVLVPQDSWVEAVKELLESQQVSMNLRHGSLLAVRLILERQFVINKVAASAAIPTIVPAFVSSFPRDSLSPCPEIVTAHLEAQNSAGIILMWGSSIDRNNSSQVDSSSVELFAYSPATDFLQLNSDSPYATWHPTCIALAKRSVCRLTLQQDYPKFSEVLLHALHIGTDVALATLSYVSGTKLAVSPKALLAVCNAYVSAAAVSESSEIRAAALEELFDVLALALPRFDISPELISEILTALVKAQDVPKRESPAVNNAELQISGWLLLARMHLVQDETKQNEIQLHSWVRALSLAGKKTEDFDTRMAAALALESFYINLHHVPDFSRDLLLPCHLALYDCLNDDDSEIREIAARTYSAFTSQSFTSLAVQQAIASDILKNYAAHPLLLWNVVSRMTGSLEVLLTESYTLGSPETMFKTALNVDNTLFVEEDQNLYIDEVRDVKFWGQIFEDLCKRNVTGESDVILRGKPLETFVTWTAEAVEALNVIGKQDGILGWISKPAAYSACMRTIVSAKVLLKYESQLEASFKTESMDKDLKGISQGLEEITTRSAAIGFHELLHAELIKTCSEDGPSSGKLQPTSG